MAPACVGPDVRAMVDGMAPGDVILLENLRFHVEEQENEDGFARRLAELCDVYINDAFAVSHRTNASVVAITDHVADRGAGFLLDQELDYFQKAMTDPQRPLVAVVGGAKVSSKLAALENMLAHVNAIIIGGAMANTFLKSKGHDVGASMVEEDMISKAASVLTEAEKKDIAVYLPVDVVVADRMAPDAAAGTAKVQEIPSGWMALDIGPETSKRYGEVIGSAKTIVWNGPMGVFEMDAFSYGTLDMARHIAGSTALSVVGGGDTVAAVHKSGVSEKVDYISTGGGAFLTLMEGRRLPAVIALDTDR
jgi:phosphoglycerate kinase